MGMGIILAVSVASFGGQVVRSSCSLTDGFSRRNVPSGICTSVGHFMTALFLILSVSVHVCVYFRINSIRWAFRW